jgi:hypothetical protein
MKPIGLFFLAISFAALMRGTGYAAPSNQAPEQTSPEGTAKTISAHPRNSEHVALADNVKHQKDEKPSHEQRDQPYSVDKNSARSRTSLIRENRPKQVLNNQGASTSESAMSLHQQDSAKSGGGAKDGLIPSETLSNALPVRPRSVVIRPTVPSPNSLRHRGANPAVVGGSVNSERRNTGVITGTHVYHKT